MFVYSVRATTIKFFGVICVALAALITLIAFVPTYVSDGTAQTLGNGEVSYDRIKTADDAAAFLRQFGWEVDTTTAQTVEVNMPESFDKVFSGYNELQKRQGLDLSKYTGKTVTRYTFTVSNYKEAEGTVYANVLVYRNRVIGGDLCSADVTGFVSGFEGQM
ncbi:MAG: DUF4830 domain-containing protein [Clostridia bacterium]|nr:DUF4830 domain-containing protein [Clostridia bacterium]